MLLQAVLHDLRLGHGLQRVELFRLSALHQEDVAELPLAELLDEYQVGHRHVCHFRSEVRVLIVEFFLGEQCLLRGRLSRSC